MKLRAIINIIEIEGFPRTEYGSMLREVAIVRVVQAVYRRFSADRRKRAAYPNPR